MTNHTPPPLPLDVLGSVPSAQASLGNGGSAQRERRFMYDNREFDDPGPQYAIRDVMKFLAETYPELANGSWTTTNLGDYDVITFYKVTGEKGLDHALQKHALALSRISIALDFAEEAEETDFWWRSALKWERFAAMWQEVVEVEARKAS